MTISRMPDEVIAPPESLTERERRTATCSESLNDFMSCHRTLYLGYFFDGTRNNFHYDKPGKSHSNVARLYDAFKEQQEPDEDRRYRFRTYIPGAGTEFWTGVGDAGVGLHAVAGAAAGWGGEARINWALLQLQNNLHAYAFNGEPLTNEETDRALVQHMSTDIKLKQLKDAFPADSNPPTPKTPADRDLRGALSNMQNLQTVASTEWRHPDTDARRKVLAERRAVLMNMLTPILTGKLPKISQIRISVFGFSRGAAEARVFVNWMRDLCDNANGPMRICGVPAQVDFLGLFDTVASVGFAQSMLEDVATGHGGWGQRRDLRIPGPSVVKRCLHLLAGHEVRGSFPVDAASGPNVEEVVYPGVHADVGGGYRPMEQGRGMQDSAKLSQLPLCHMYRAAIAAGVPLMDLANAQKAVRQAFAVSTDLITRFNAYMAQVRPPSSGNHSTESLVQRHYQEFLHWRRFRLGQHSTLAVYKASSRQDQEDQVTADNELNVEWQLMLKAKTAVGIRNSVQGGYSGMLFELGLMGVKIVLLAVKNSLSFVLGSTIGYGTRQRFDDLPGGTLAQVSPAFTGLQMVELSDALLDAAESKWEQWRQVENAWNRIGQPHPAICALFENDMHDSRAWFKPLGDDDDVWEEKQRKRLRELMKKEERHNAWAGSGSVRIVDAAGPMIGIMAPAFTQSERAELLAYRKRIDGRTLAPGEIPADALPLQSSGREVYFLWGYLRWRTVYQDHYTDMRATYPALANADRATLRERKRALERQSNQLTAAGKQAEKRFKASVSVGGAWGRSGGGGYSTAALQEAQNIALQRNTIERELQAVNTFLDELGPAPWWESLAKAAEQGMMSVP